jgi:hypothetical protein
MDSTQLERWLAEAKTEKVIAEFLRPDARLDPDLRHEATLISSRFENLERAKRLGTLDFNNENRERAAINAALLDIVRRLKTDPKRGFFTNSWAKWGSIAVAVVGVLGGVAEFSGFSLRDIFGKKDSPSSTVPAPQTDKPAGQTAANPTTSVPQTQPETQRQPAVSSGEKPVPALPTKPDTTLTIACKSNKGRLNLYFKNGETMRFYVKVSQPCFLRSIYKLADGRLVLFDADRRVAASEVGQWLEIGPGFEATEPFGEERLYVFAQSSDFAPLATSKDSDGYLFIKEGLPEALQKTRGFKKKLRFAEDDLMLKTTL